MKRIKWQDTFIWYPRTNDRRMMKHCNTWAWAPRRGARGPAGAGRARRSAAGRGGPAPASRARRRWRCTKYLRRSTLSVTCLLNINGTMRRLILNWAHLTSLQADVPLRTWPERRGRRHAVQVGGARGARRAARLRVARPPAPVLCTNTH